MSASLVMQNAYTNTSGVITLVVAGGNPYPLLPASSVLGFSVTVNGSGATISTATAANEQVTITLLVAPTAGQTILVSYNAGIGNLTDSNGTPNTLPTTSNFACTNNVGNTLTPFTSAASAALFTYLWASTTHGGQSVLQTSYTSSRIDAVFTGTQIDIQIDFFAAAEVFTYIAIDGVKLTTLPPALHNDTFEWITLTIPGLADASHTVTILFNGNINNGINVVSTAAFRVYGSSPAMSAPTNITSINAVTTAATRSAVRNDFGVYTYRSGSNFQDYANGNASTVGPFTDGCLTFTAQCTDIWLFMVLDGTSKFRLKIDPQNPNCTQQSTVTLPASPGGGQIDWFHLATGLDATTPHVYQIVNVLGASTSTATSIKAFGFAGSTGMVLGSGSPAVTAAIGGMGDSIMQGNVPTTGGGTADLSLAFMYMMARAKGWMWLNCGISGTLVWSGGGTNNMAGRAGQITAMSPAPSFIIMEGVLNDAQQLAGAETSAQFGASYTSCLNTWIAGLPTTPIICMGQIITALTTAESNRAAFKTAQLAAIAGCTTPANVVFQDQAAYGLIQYSDYASDDEHPNASGQSKIYTIVVSDLVTSVPPTPTGLAAGTKTVTYTLTWNTATGATGYDVYKNGSGTPFYTGSAATTTDTVTLGSLNTYTVDAFNIQGNSPKSSPAVSVQAGYATQGGGGSVTNTLDPSA